MRCSRCGYSHLSFEENTVTVKTFILSPSVNLDSADANGISSDDRGGVDLVCNQCGLVIKNRGTHYEMVA